MGEPWVEFKGGPWDGIAFNALAKQMNTTELYDAGRLIGRWCFMATQSGETGRALPDLPLDIVEASKKIGLEPFKRQGEHCYVLVSRGGSGGSPFMEFEWRNDF